MKKLYIMIFIILSLVITFVIFTSTPKDYQVNYTINKVDITEKYQKATNDYHFILKYKNIEYPYIIKTEYSKKRKLITDVKIIEDKKDTCLTILSKNNKQTLCSDKKGLKDYHLINDDLYGKNFKSKKEEKVIKTYEKINIYNNTYNYLIWNYKGYINLNKNNNENIKIFNNENYSTLNTYQIDKYLIIPDYDSKYYFTKMYIFDTEKQLLNDISFDYEISYDLLYLGEVKNKLYFIDKKNKNEYYLNFKKLEIKKVKIKNDKIDIYENGECNNQSLKDVINKNISFTFAQSYNYKIIDDNLYQIIDNHNIKISNQKITSIISSNENQVFYLVGTKLYCYNANGENLLLEYKEWKFNYLNQIFIFN